MVCLKVDIGGWVKRRHPFSFLGEAKRFNTKQVPFILSFNNNCSFNKPFLPYLLLPKHPPPEQKDILPRQNTLPLSNPCFLDSPVTKLWKLKQNICVRNNPVNLLIENQSKPLKLTSSMLIPSSLPRDYCGDCVQMRLSCSPLAPFLLYLIEWLDYTCTDALPNLLGLHHILVYKVYVDGMPTMSSQEKRATVKEFYAVIYPSLMQLDGSCDRVARKRVDDKRKLLDRDLEREDECGICMEPGTKMVLPTCGHSMCIKCFHDWNSRSRSCPFCRGSLKRVKSKDLWVLTSNNEVVDSLTIARENLSRFYLYIESLPLVSPDNLVFVYDYMI